MAEFEIGLLARTCLDRRIESVGEFEKEVMAYLEWKNKHSKPINWQFTNESARIKLKSLYPPSLDEFCRTTILKRADEILKQRSRSTYPKSAPPIAKVADMPKNPD